jgi:hypothetical protein
MLGQKIAYSSFVTVHGVLIPCTIKELIAIFFQQALFSNTFILLIISAISSSVNLVINLMLRFFQSRLFT